MKLRPVLAALALACAFAGPALAQSQASPYRGPSGSQIPASGVQTIGSPSFAPAQISVGTSPTLIVGATVGRGWLCLTNTSATVVYLGGPAVTTSTGHALGAGAAGAAGCIPYTGALYGVVASGTATVTEAEIY